MNWKPIETAPRDGSEILACRTGNFEGWYYQIIRWHEDGWFNEEFISMDDMTHWTEIIPPDAQL